MRSFLKIAMTVLITIPALAQANPTSGYDSFKTLQTFLLGTDNWGKSTKGLCRFDFSLEPDMSVRDGIIPSESVSAYVRLDQPAEGYLSFADSIGYSGMSISQINSRTLVIEGGSYDGSAKLQLTKQKNGSVKIYAQWDDNEMGPDRSGSCVLPLVQK